jgi:hypothetical protein
MQMSNWKLKIMHFCFLTPQELPIMNLFVQNSKKSTPPSSFGTFMAARSLKRTGFNTIHVDFEPWQCAYPHNTFSKVMFGPKKVLEPPLFGPV